MHDINYKVPGTRYCLLRGGWGVMDELNVTLIYFVPVTCVDMVQGAAEDINGTLMF